MRKTEIETLWNALVKIQDPNNKIQNMYGTFTPLTDKEYELLKRIENVTYETKYCIPEEQEIVVSGRIDMSFLFLEFVDPDKKPQHSVSITKESIIDLFLFLKHLSMSYERIKLPEISERS